MIAGLPVVAGPILLVYALAHGRSFAADAAAGTLLGLVSLIAFVVVYARMAGRYLWSACVLAGWLAFGLATLAFSAVSVPPGGALAIAAVGLSQASRRSPGRAGRHPPMTVRHAGTCPCGLPAR